MSSEHDINGKEAIDKLQDLVNGTPSCMMITSIDTSVNGCPMHTQEVDSTGNFWFFSRRDSEHHTQLLKNNRVHLIYNNHREGEYLSVSGDLYISDLPERIEELWSPVLESYYDGKTDPNLCLYRVEPESAHYWENKNGQLSTYLQMIKAAITKNKTDISIDGEIRV